MVLVVVVEPAPPAPPVDPLVADVLPVLVVDVAAVVIEPVLDVVDVASPPAPVVVPDDVVFFGPPLESSEEHCTCATRASGTPMTAAIRSDRWAIFGSMAKSLLLRTAATFSAGFEKFRHW
jgi:hypothetical protein